MDKQNVTSPAPAGQAKPQKPVETWVYLIRKPNGAWLAQVVLTSDGMFAAVSDYGNASFAWRAFGADFRAFLLGVDSDYFGQKMANGQAYVTGTSRKITANCMRFAEQILPALKTAIVDEQLGEGVL
jgi:hypothetical protein